jgi:integrase/recombinase XerC
MPIAQIANFLNYLQYQKRYSVNTVAAYTNDLESFFNFIAANYNITETHQVTAAFIRTWLATLKNSGIASKSINRKISAVKSFFKYQLKQQVITNNPASGLVAQKVSKRLPVFLEQAATDTLFNHIEFTNDFTGHTHALVLHLLYNTGMRRAEVIGLKEADVDYYQKQIKVLGKGNKERLIPVSHDLLQLIKQYTSLKTASTTTLLINKKGLPLSPNQVHQITTKYVALVTTVNKKSPHVFRHTFATQLLNNGADINAVKELLGHSSLAATQIYTQNSIEVLKEVYKKAHPKS